MVEADNLEALAALPDGCVDLAYADPPFATGEAQRLASIRTGRRGADPARVRRPRVPLRGRCSDLAWDDDLPLDAHLEALGARRVREVHRVLAPHGSLYLHVDWRTVHHVRLLLDEVFGRRAVPQRAGLGVRLRRPATRPLAAQARHDPVVREGRPWLFDRDAIDRVPYLAPGLVGPEKAARGKLPTDVWWMTIVPPGLRRADRLPDPEAGAAARADRRGVEPAGRPRPRSVRGQRDDRRGGGAAGPAVAARRPRTRWPSRSPGGRLDRGARSRRP